MSTTIARGAWCAALLVPSVALAQLERVTSGESRAVTARNPLPIERRDETIALPWSAVAGLRGAEPGRVRVADAAGREVLSQLLDVNADGQPDSLLFQASFGPNETRSFQLQATAPATRVASRVAVRHDDPRDDMAWENDLVAFRIYGEGLKKTPSAMSSNGIDIWLKRTRDLIVEKWYAKGHDAYHIDTGEGADFFDVGTTLGVGGTALWRGDSLQRADNFKAWKVIATGPIRAVFELRYDPWGDAGLRVTEVKRVSIDAGQQLYRVESTFQPVGSSAATLPLATGVVKRPGMVGIMNRERPWAWVTGWGPVARKNGGHGELGTAVLVPRDRLVDWKETGNHYLAVTRAAAGQPWVQYNGFAWTAAGDVTSPQAWWSYLDQFAQRLAAPIVVTM